MGHNVVKARNIVNNMDQDVALGITTSVTQAQLVGLRAENRLGDYAVVYRVNRAVMGGGFGDQQRHPFAWAVMVYVDGQAARLYSARGLPREWNDLDRLECWLRDHGFWYWWTRNGLEPLGSGEFSDPEEGNPWPLHHSQ